jgi:glycine cleavage system H protein
MVVLLVIATFAVFIIIDAILNRRKIAALTPAPVPAGVPTDPEIVHGFRLPSNLRYHPGHTWLARERKNVHRVGADAFAASIAGPVEQIELPKPGHWIRQGQKVISFVRNGEKLEMVSPVEGEVVEVNPAVIENPGLLHADPYGKGWLMTVFAPDEEGPARNLLPASLIPSWMKDAAERLYRFQPQLAGATSADGGLPVADAAAALPATAWKDMGKEFFLS